MILHNLKNEASKVSLFLPRIVLFVSIILGFLNLHATDYYWVGDQGDWHVLSNWSLVSGQTQTPSSLPDSNDHVFFDSFSFISTNPVVNVGTYAQCKQLLMHIPAHINPVFEGGLIEVHDTTVLFNTVTMNLELKARCVGNSLPLWTQGAYIAVLKPDCSSFELLLQDSLYVGRLLLENGIFNAQGKEINARYVSNVNHRSQSSYIFSHSTLFVDTLALIQDVFFTADLTHSIIHLNSLFITCASVDYATIIVSSRATIGYSENTFCNTSGASFIEIDTLRVGSGASLHVADHSGQVTELRVDYMSINQQAKATFLRPVEVGVMDLAGQLSVLKSEVAFEFLNMGPQSELVLGSTQGQEIRMRLRQEWNVWGTCQNRVYIRSQSLGAVSRVETTGMLTFDYAQIVDIELMGGGGQDLTNTVVAGNSSGIQITPDPGRRFYWIGNSGDWHQGANWSFEDGGSPAGCVPGITDSVYFTEHSFMNSGAQVYVQSSTLFMSYLMCTNPGLPFALVSDSLQIYHLGSAYMGNKMQLQGPTELHLFVDTDTLDIRGAQNLLLLKPQGISDLVIITDSLTTPQCRFHAEQMSIEVRGSFWQAYAFEFHDVEAQIELQALHLRSLDVLGEESEWIASQTQMNVISHCTVLGKPAQISSLRYFGGDTVMINLYSQLDTLFFNRPAHFFTFNDTLPDTTYFTFRAMFNESGMQGQTTIKGLAATQAMVIRDVDFNNCEFDFLNLGVANEITLSGNLTINRNMSNQSQCNRITYFRKHQDSIAKNCFLISQPDSLILRGLHCYHIDAVGGVKVIVQNGVDMGNNSGLEFRNSGGRTLYWIGGTGSYFLPDNWSEQSNGPPALCIPTALDTVIFDSFSFSSTQTDTVFLNLHHRIAVKTWHIKPGIQRKPLFFSHSPVTLWVVKDFLQQSDADWSLPVTVSFLTSRDTSFIDHSIQSESVRLSMNHQGVFNRFMLLDTLRVREINLGFGTLISDSHPIYAQKFYAGKTQGYPVGSGNGFFQAPNTYLEIDTFNMYQEEGLVGFLKNRANLQGSTVNTIYYLLACEPMQHPQKIIFRDSVLGVLIPAQDEILQGYIDTVIALGNMEVQTLGNTVPYNVLEGGYIEAHQKVSLLFPLSFEFGIRNHDAEFEFNHFYQTLELAPNHEYVFRDQAELTYDFIFAPGSHCEPITIISKVESETYTFDRGTGGVFDAQGIRMRDCIAAQAPTYMGPQSIDLGNNTGWVQGRNPNFNLTDLSEDFILCENDSIFISPTTLYQHAREYIWKRNGEDIDVSPFGFILSQEGKYTVEVKYTDDCSLFDTAQVDVFSRDLLNIGNDTIFCEGGFAMLNADLGSDKLYVWSTGSRRPQINPIRTGLYWVKVTHPEGCTITDSAQVLVVRKPVNPAGTDTVVCSDANYITGRTFRGYQYLWSTGDTTFTIPVTESGTYRVVIQNDYCVVEDSVHITLQNPLRFSIGSDTVLPLGSTLVLSADTMLSHYLWSTGSTDPTLLVDTDGIYTLTFQDSFCTTSDSVRIRFVLPPEVRFDQDTLRICFGDSIDLIPRVNKTGLDYLWDPLSTDSVLRNQSLTGWYSVVVSDSFFSDTASTFIWVLEDLGFSLGPDTHFCENSSLLLDPQLGDAFKYAWNTGDTMPSIRVLTPGQYILTVRLQNCFYSDSIDITERAFPLVSSFPDTVLCQGEVLRYDLSSWPYTLFWNNGSQSKFREWTDSEFVTLRVSNRGCDTLLDFNISFQEPPELSLGADTAYCEGDTLVLDAGRDFAVTYRWDHGPETPAIWVVSPGMYGVTLFDGVCETYDSLFVSEEPMPMLYLGPDTTLCYDEPILIRVEPQTDYAIMWNDGSDDWDYLATDTGRITATLSNQTCSASDSLMVYLCECSQVFIPNALSPNNDGINDQFQVNLPCNYTQFRMQIFNRWGQQVFESESVTEPWDGTQKGKPLPPGVYAYSISFEAIRSQTQERESVNWVGSVTLIR